jgi:hypothetical protein
MNHLRASLDELLNREVDRKEFLLHLAMAGVSVVGISSIIRSLTSPQQKPQPKAGGGYGGSAYGS